MKILATFNDFLIELGDDEASDWYSLVHSEPDTESDVVAFERRIGFRLPRELRELYVKDGAIRTNEYGDVWQTLRLDPLKSMLEESRGLCAYIDRMWGGRPELVDELSSDQISALNADYVVFGSRYEDDNVHEYFFFHRSGRIDSLRLDQDDMSDAFEKFGTLLENKMRDLSLEALLNEQLDLIQTTIEEDYG